MFLQLLGLHKRLQANAFYHDLLLLDYCGDFLPRVYPHVPSHVCPRGNTLAEPRVTLFIVDRKTFGTLGNILLEPFRATERTTSSWQPPNPLWYARRWLYDTGMTDGTLPILMSTSVDWHVQSQTFNRIEWMASCVMTRCLTQPPTTLQLQWLPCHLLRNHHNNIKSRVSSTSLCFPHLSTIKNPTTHVHNTMDSLIYSLKGFLPISKSNLGFEECVQTTCPDIFSVGKKKSPFSGSWAEAFATTTKGGIHPQLTWYQYWRCLWERDKDVNTLQKSVVGHG